MINVNRKIILNNFSDVVLAEDFENLWFSSTGITVKPKPQQIL